MTGLFIDISDYIPDPVIEEVDRAIRLIGTPIEDYDLIPSRSNIEGWENIRETRGADKKPRKKKQPYNDICVCK